MSNPTLYLEINIDPKTGYITRAVMYDPQTGEHDDLLQHEMPDFYDNGSRGWRLNKGQEYSIFLSEESFDPEEDE